MESVIMRKNYLAKSISFALLASAAVSTTAIADENTDIEKIVIKGQKIDRSLQETPTSVAVLTASDLETNNISSVSEIFAMMPNVSGDFSEGFNIRGVDAFSVSGGGNSFLATIYMDGAPLPFRMAKSGGLSMWDISQVEVFRGPQSTLQGRNSLAGAIVLRSQDPTYETNGKFKLTAGNHGQRGYAFAGGTSLINDVLAIRVSYEDTAYDGDIENITRKEGSNFEDSETLRAKVLFEPTENVDALFTYTRNENKYGPTWSKFNHGSSAFDRTVDTNSYIWEETKTDIFNLEVSWDISDELSFHSITTYNDSEYGYNWDGDMQPTQIVVDTQDFRVDKTFSQELRLAYDGENVKAVAGFYTSKVDVKDDAIGERFYPLQSAIGTSDFGVAITGLLMQQGLDATTAAQTAAFVSPLYPNIDPIILSMNYGLNQEIKSSAIYGDITWSVNDKFNILAGLRYDTEEQSNSSNNDYQVKNTLPNPAAVPAQIAPVVTGVNAYLHSLAANASGIGEKSKDDFNAWLPKLGATYHIDDDSSASLIYQRGYRSGGVGFNIAQGESYKYAPEYTNNFELSYRSVNLDGDLVFNANLFMLKWTDQQIEKRGTSQFDTETVNSGKSEVKGFETEIFYTPNDNLTLKAGLGLAKSEFTQFIIEVEGQDDLNYSGQRFHDSPEWTANIAAKYDFDNGVYINANAKYQDASPAYLDAKRSVGAERYALDKNPQNDGRTIVNATLGYNWDKYSVRLDVENLFDKDYIAYYTRNALPGEGFNNYGQQSIGKSRQISASFQMQF